MKKRAVLKVYGKVQNVFFRDFACQKGQELDLCGWVRNEPDGSVQAVAEGEDEQLEAFIDCCSEGPKHAKVDRVEAKWLPCTGEFTDFQVR